MTVAAIAATLWPIARGLLIRIGRWLVRRVKARGAQVVAHYMQARTDVFRDRLNRARKRGQKRRVAWLRGRIRRWLRAARWLLEHAERLNARVSSALERLALAERIPSRAPWESYAGWSRAN